MSVHASAEAEACRHLWVAVLEQAALDILSPASPRGTGCKGGGAAARIAANGWLRTLDFEVVCALAGIAPDTARTRIEALLIDLAAGARDWRQVVAGTGAAAGIGRWHRDDA